MKKLILSICILSLMVIAGCAVSKKVTGPDGETLYSINCSGYALDMGSCLEKAGQICGQAGYDIIMGTTENHGPMSTANQYGFFSAPLVARELIIRCRKTNIPN